MTGEPVEVRSVMPATVRASDTHLVAALRRRIDRGLGRERPPLTDNWIDAYESKDNGKSSEALPECECSPTRGFQLPFSG